MDHESNTPSKKILVIGASSTIARAIIDYSIEKEGGSSDSVSIDSVSRSSKPENLPSDCVEWHQTDYSEESIEKICQELSGTLSELDLIVISNGKLHDTSYMPEKRAKDFNLDNFLDVVTCNTVIPLLWLKHVQPFLPRKKPTNIVVFSARVGSISDNELGGWYSYRASKAALNMLMKTFAVELSRTKPLSKMFIFHPGTTDTPLSKPFQKNVPEDKLFSADFVAKQLLKHIENPPSEENIIYLDWQGKKIEW